MQWWPKKSCGRDISWTDRRILTEVCMHITYVWGHHRTAAISLAATGRTTACYVVSRNSSPLVLLYVKFVCNRRTANIGFIQIYRWCCTQGARFQNGSASAAAELAATAVNAAVFANPCMLQHCRKWIGAACIDGRCQPAGNIKSWAVLHTLYELLSYKLLLPVLIIRLEAIGFSRIMNSLYGAFCQCSHVRL